jgi:hypothetical protein
VADQIVQVGHACLEAGRQFEQPQAPCRLVVLSVSSAQQLQAVVEQLELIGVRCAIFYEPDDNLGLTAACTEPITGIIRRAFRRFPLWQPQASTRGERDPPELF